ncbi:Ger(x)C family spore germination protein [Paenibacillus arenilitoris]|uniref:Ger(X)C family spore germination protein n=1 Tax=Paenibacillus arenilitoris TaxID=2772299 RepID=A0A927CQA0_9BACL|nr:Ger(x)C family spore germination protein [Paenibacillus arenilitoris]MBD2870291.1 Ger(x)C family spore germination protein [Paenibacillus arenilitoris]
MAKSAPVIAVIALACLLTGCWSRTEVNDIAIVTATGLDRLKSGRLKVSLLLAVPRTVGNTGQGGGGELEQTSGWVVSDEGETIMDAFRNIQKKLPRNIFYPHNRAIVIGESLAKSDILAILDFFQRSRQTQMRSYVLFTKKEAADILRFKPKFEKLTAEIIKEEMKTGVNVHVRLNEFINMFLETGREAYAPRIEVVPAEVKSASKEKLTSLKLTGMGVMRGNRLIGWLNAEETRGVLWLRDEMEEGVITVDIPDERGGGKISGEVQKARSRLKVRRAGQSFIVDVRVETELDIYENQSPLSLKELNNLTYVESLFKHDIENRILTACRKAQQYETDFIGIGRSLYMTHPGQWKQHRSGWNESLRTFDFQVGANVHIVRVGMINEPITERE